MTSEWIMTSERFGSRPSDTLMPFSISDNGLARLGSQRPKWYHLDDTQLTSRGSEELNRLLDQSRMKPK